MLAQLNQYLAWNEHLSGWAQFIGGLLAVYAAFVIARSDQRAADRAHDRRQVALENAAIDSVGRGVAALLARVKILTSPEHWSDVQEHGLSLDVIETVVGELDSFPRTELDDANISFHMQRVRLRLASEVENLGRAVTIIQHVGYLDAHLIKALIAIEGDVEPATTGLIEAIEAARVNRKSYFHATIQKTLSRRGVRAIEADGG